MPRAGKVVLTEANMVLRKNRTLTLLGQAKGKRLYSIPIGKLITLRYVVAKQKKSTGAIMRIRVRVPTEPSEGTTGIHRKNKSPQC